MALTDGLSAEERGRLPLGVRLISGPAVLTTLVIAVLGDDASDLLFSEKFACSYCGISYPELEPRLFSFNNPAGACPTCEGLGNKMVIDPDLVVPDPSAIAILNHESGKTSDA